MPASPVKTTFSDRNRLKTSRPPWLVRTLCNRRGIDKIRMYSPCQFDSVTGGQFYNFLRRTGNAGHNHPLDPALFRARQHSRQITSGRQPVEMTMCIEPAHTYSPMQILYIAHYIISIYFRSRSRNRNRNRNRYRYRYPTICAICAICG